MKMLLLLCRARGVFALSALLFSIASPARGANWPQFRGASGLGVAEGKEPPTYFGPASNVLWKTTSPPGNSSPVIWGKQLFLTAHDNTKLETLSFDRETGTVLWRRAVPVEKFEPAHKLSGPASSTPCTDGERLYSYFGSFGVIAYDLNGEEKWRVPLPQPVVEFGTGTSPITVGELVIIQCDQDENSYLLAVNRRTGKTVWRTERPEFRRGFSTPFVWRHDDGMELITAGSIWLTSYKSFRWQRALAVHRNGARRQLLRQWRAMDCSSARAGTSAAILARGSAWSHSRNSRARMTRQGSEAHARGNSNCPIKERFSQMDLNKDNVVTPAEWQMMREMFDRAENAVLAIRLGGKNDLTKTHLAWKSMRSLPYVSSPLYYRGRLYTVKSGGLLSCYEAKTGKPFYQDERLGAAADYYSSAVVVGEKIFLTSQNGVMLVLRAGGQLRGPCEEHVRRTDLRDASDCGRNTLRANDRKSFRVHAMRITFLFVRWPSAF
jgi:outer membrane protein assembly factor BamB